MDGRSFVMEARMIAYGPVRIQTAVKEINGTTKLDVRLSDLKSSSYLSTNLPTPTVKDRD